MAKKRKTIFEDSLEKEGILLEKKHSHEFIDEPEEHEENFEEVEEEIDIGEKDREIYTEEGREKLIEGEEITEWEEAYAEGAEEKGELGVCENCGKPLGQRNEVYEREIEGEIKFFCSEKCAEEYTENIESTD